MNDDERSPAGPEGVYEERAARFGAGGQVLHRWERWVQWARLAVFLGAGLALAEALGASGAGRWGWLAGCGGLLGFFGGLVVLHDRLLQRSRRLATLARLNDEAGRRLARRWAGLPPATACVEPIPSWAQDLDLFGEASLLQLLDTTQTPLGRRCLQQWLLHPAAPSELLDRQEAARELAGQLDLRQELAMLGAHAAPPGPRSAAEGLRAVEAFCDWATSPPWLLAHRGLRLLVLLGPACALALGIARLLHLVTGPWWVLPLLLNGVLLAAFGKRAREGLDVAERRHGRASATWPLFGLLETTRLTSPLLARLDRQLRHGGQPVARRLRALDGLLSWAELRNTPLAHAPAQLLLLWDFQLLARLEAWKRGAGDSVRTWFTALGEIEAAAALASLAHDHPGWGFPTFAPPTEERLVATGLGHPLLPVGRCVTNDLELGPCGQFALISGANMSGKSTLLRALGTNVVLAQAGAPVCARSFRLPPLRLCTSVRLDDSLRDGVSYYLAELLRVKEILDAAATAGRLGEPSPEPPLLFLIDEILRGTNSVERKAGAIRIVATLLRYRTLGAIATHDLELAAAPELQARCTAYHLGERLEGPAASEPGSPGPLAGLGIAFDYQLHPGLLSTTNALRLLEVVCGLAGR